MMSTTGARPRRRRRLAALLREVTALGASVRFDRLETPLNSMPICAHPFAESLSSDSSTWAQKRVHACQSSDRRFAQQRIGDEREERHWRRQPEGQPCGGLLTEPAKHRAPPTQIAAQEQEDAQQ